MADKKLSFKELSTLTNLMVQNSSDVQGANSKTYIIELEDEKLVIQKKHDDVKVNIESYNLAFSVLDDLVPRSLWYDGKIHIKSYISRIPYITFSINHDDNQVPLHLLESLSISLQKIMSKHLTHRDLNNFNIIVNEHDGSLLGIIDWDEANTITAIGSDLHFLLLYIGYICIDGYKFYDNYREGIKIIKKIINHNDEMVNASVISGLSYYSSMEIKNATMIHLFKQLFHQKTNWINCPETLELV